MGILVRNNKVISAGGKILYRRTGDPFELPNLKLYLSATRMVQQADESLVSSFSDFSGFGYHATQATSGNQPKFDTNQFGVNAGVKFDGIDDFLSLTGGALDIFRNINQYTFQIAFKRTVLSLTNQYVFSIGRGVSLSGRLNVEFRSTGVIRILVRKADTDPSILIDIASYDLNAHLIQVTLNPSNYTVYVYLDGILAGSSPLASSGNLDNTASLGLGIGGDYNGTGTSYVSINGICVTQSYSDQNIISSQYRGYLSRGYL